MKWRDTRYNRQEAIPRLGLAGQRRLKKRRVAVIGAGGVKSPLLFYLAAAGIGFLRIIDYDRVELSNLNRQILYSTQDIGKHKAEAAAERLAALNPDIDVEPVVARITDDNFDELLAGFDLVFEGGDSAEGRQLFNREAVARNICYIHASAQYNYAYVFTVVPYVSACFECIYSDLPPSHGGPVPVLGCATGVAGAVAACEAINILSGVGPTLANRIWLHEGWTNETFSISVRRKESCCVCGSIRTKDTLG